MSDFGFDLKFSLDAIGEIWQLASEPHLDAGLVKSLALDRLFEVPSFLGGN